MAEIRTQHLITLTLQVSGMQVIGATPAGNRRIGPGRRRRTFTGERLRGSRAAERHRHWIIVRPDGATTLDVRLVLETDDKAQIGLTYRGMRHGPSAVMDRLNRGENVDPSEYYFRTSTAFETAAPRSTDWLEPHHRGRSTGRRPPAGPVYDIFEVHS